MENWQVIIADIKQSGMTQPQIAAEVPCSQSYVSDLENGKRGQRISHKIASGLLALHKKVTQKAEETT
ncbi:transcriptional regulator [Acinetobacter pittii]|uniref:helix-turn-helix domain-containing protein n=1 Tax=Acinetobacter pittii TaxID=48296 RepID=UPI000A355DC2|nr:helix-turn-helix transcriptional regulator [Acinetobacter pittii]EIB6856894.1 helix-turn-helix domain-containing protein [Acinetobacter baumannii]OTL80082.1 transcriptional regulator [Acinetobacter pittii]